MMMKALKGLLWMVLVLAACKPAEPRPTLTPADTVTPPPTSTPFVFPATWTPVPTAVPIPVLRPQQTLLAREPIHDVIIFDTSWLFPLNAPFNGSNPDTREYQLWALSPDGRRSGAILNWWDAAWHSFAPARPYVLVAANKPVVFQDEHFEELSLPNECANITEEHLKCKGFLFSPNGQWMGVLWGEEGWGCGRPSALLDIATGVTQTIIADNTHSMSFLPDGRMLVTAGHCEGGWFYLFDPGTGQSTQLGGEGQVIWNSTGTAFVVQTTPYQGIQYGVWGYNLKTNQGFPSDGDIRDRPTWTTDGTALLYQQRSYTFSMESFNYYVFDTSRQIFAVDMKTSRPEVLVSDPAFDFNLCCAGWQGDWIQVQRYPFYSQATTKPNDELWRDPPDGAVQCRLQGVCSESPVYFALNWRTGELVPWEQAPLPTVTPTPVPTATPIPGPDLDSTPIYAEPSGAYGFYVGQDGQSLWMVPAKGKPQLWVTEGKNFVYIP